MDLRLCLQQSWHKVRPKLDERSGPAGMAPGEEVGEIPAELIHPMCFIDNDQVIRAEKARTKVGPGV